MRRTPLGSNYEQQKHWIELSNSPNNELPYQVPSMFSYQHLRGIMDMARRPVRPPVQNTFPNTIPYPGSAASSFSSAPNQPKRQ